jgi:hypothetical protein
MSITIVSAIIANCNNDKTIEKYIELGKILIDCNINKILFIDELIFDEINKYKSENTIIIKVTKNDLYLYNYLDKMNNFNLETDNKNKDTIDFIFLMCNKTEFVRKAIEINSFNSNNFIWVDFGLRHVFDSDINFTNQINNLKHKYYDKIRIGHIWNLNKNYNINPIVSIMWYFAGGVFGGNTKYLLEFADKTKNMCIDIINTHNTLMWEVNVWYLVFKSFPELFNPYYCEHNYSILENY